MFQKLIKLRYFNQQKLHWKFLSKIIELCFKYLFSCYISDRANVHSSTIFPHPTGIVIGNGVVIEKGCVIYQNVTLGGGDSRRRRLIMQSRGEEYTYRYPIIKQNTIIYGNSIIVGDIEIGPDSEVGAGSIVLKPVEEFAIVAGNPAKKISDVRKYQENNN